MSRFMATYLRSSSWRTNVRSHEGTPAYMPSASKRTVVCAPTTTSVTSPHGMRWLSHLHASPRPRPGATWVCAAELVAERVSERVYGGVHFGRCALNGRVFHDGEDVDRRRWPIRLV
mgnify:CR=1 FL=1